MDSFSTFTSALGASLILYISYKLLDTAWLYTRPSTLHRYLYTDTPGQRAWALITGSSNGIGKCLAFELADHGFNIVLHGRNPGKLETVRRELQTSYPKTAVRVIVADASQCHRAEAVDFARIRDELASVPLTVLVNCAGCGPTPAFGALETYGCDDILDTLHLNAAFPTLLTATLLPVLRGEYTTACNGAKKPNGHAANGNATATAIPRPRGRRRALIINIGSVTDDGFPLVSFYSAGKAATHALHQSLAREAALHAAEGAAETEVISHRVGAVTGVSHTQAPATLFRPEARTIARAVLARTGCGRKSVVPYWPHALLHGVLWALPAWMLDGAINAGMKAEIRDQEAEMEKKKGL